jgi:exonuclease VII small subunit
MTSDPADETFDERLAALEGFVAALHAGQLEMGEAMRAYRERWRPMIGQLEAELDEFRRELESQPAEDDGSGERQFGV